MQELARILAEADRDGKAVGHFNVADLVLLKGVFQAAQALNAPVIIGASEGERAFTGARQLAACVKSLREEYDFPVFLDADHTHSLASAIEAAKAGFDYVVFDLSTLPLEENARQTRKAVESVKSINPGMIVEGEIGDIGSGSEIHDDEPRGTQNLSSPEEAAQFVSATGVDVLAPAVGNSHGMRRGMVAGTEKKHLDIERIRKIKAAAGKPLTLHGGSGTDDGDLRGAIGAGINIVHINTELRLAWRRGIEEGLKKHPEELAPYKVLPPAVAAVQQVVASRLRLFANPTAG